MPRAVGTGAVGRLDRNVPDVEVAKDMCTWDSGLELCHVPLRHVLRREDDSTTATVRRFIGDAAVRPCELKGDCNYV